jgi:hypothetical protein
MLLCNGDDDKSQQRVSDWMERERWGGQSTARRPSQANPSRGGQGTARPTIRGRRIIQYYTVTIPTKYDFTQDLSGKPVFALQSGKVTHVCEDFTTDYADYTDEGRDASPRRPRTGRPASRPHLRILYPCHPVRQAKLG